MSALPDYPVITALVSGDKIVVVNASGVIKLMTYDDFIALQANTAPKLLTIGNIKHSRKYTAVSAAHPWFCLNSPSQTLNESNYPDYVPWLRDFRTDLFPASGSPQTAFAGTMTTGASGIITLTTGTNYTIFMNAIEEHYQKTGAYIRCKITNSTVSEVKYGTLALYSLVSSQVQFSYTSWSDSDTVSIELYPNIVYDGSGNLDSTKAYHTRIVGDALMAADDADGRFIGGLGRRDRMQVITGDSDSYRTNLSNNTPIINGKGALKTVNAGGSFSTGYRLQSTTDTLLNCGSLEFDSSQSANARTDDITSPDALGVYLYEYVGRYI